MNKPSVTLSDLQETLTSILPKDCGVTAIVFSDSSYLPVLRNWISHTREAGFNNILVVSLDEEVLDYANKNQIKSILMAYNNSLTDLWIQRAEFFSIICGLGYDFIHSDADAIWVKNPQNYCFDIPADMMFSQGTIWPPDVLHEWSFVLCCGFFAARASKATQSFFEQLSARVKIDKDDQATVNRLLLERQIKWDNLKMDNLEKEFKGHKYKIYNSPVLGTNGDIRLSLLPYKFFPRTVLSDMSQAFVAHPLSPKTCTDKIESLSELGLWKLNGLKI